MKFETYQNEESYDSGSNEIKESAKEQIDRIKAQKIGISILDIFNM